MERITNLAKQGLVIYGAVKPAMNRYYLVLLGIVLGMLVGIIVVPVYFRPNAEPVQMDDIYREQWIKSTANEYQYLVNTLENNPNLSDDERLQRQAVAEAEVRDRLTEVGATPGDIDRLISSNPDVEYLQTSLTAIRPLAVQVESDAAAAYDDAQIPGAFTRILITLLVFAAFAILGIVITIVFKLFDIPFLKQIRNLINPREEDPSLAAAKARRAAREQAAGLKSVFDKAPVSQFMSTYLAGDNYYDDSFAIELEDEKKTFLGECGSGISESITVAGNKKVLATEVWIFDKNDSSTIVKLLVSEAAYNDEDVRAKLAPRGDLIVAREGEQFVLETQTLRAQATVVSLEYGEGEQPNHIYDKLTVEIAVWQKEGADTGDDDGLPTPLIDVDAYLAEQESTPQQSQTPPSNIPPAPPQQPIAPPPTKQPTQPMPPQRPTGDSQPMPPQQRPPQQPPPQAPPQQRPSQPFPAQPPQQRPAMPPQQGNAPRPPMPPQGSGQRPNMPPQQQGQRPNMPPQQEGSGRRPPMPPQQRDGDTGDFNLQ